MKNLTARQTLEWIEDPDHPEHMRLWLDEQERMEAADRRILISHWCDSPFSPHTGETFRPTLPGPFPGPFGALFRPPFSGPFQALFRALSRALF
jgi:hypothetical protein